MGWLKRLVNTLDRKRRDEDLEEEIAFHITSRAEEFIARGVPAEIARRDARQQFGSESRTCEAMRQVDTLPWLERLTRDASHALHAVRRDPGFTLVATVSLALGIGANTAIFTLANALLLKPLPVTRPDELVTLVAREGENTVPLMATMVARIREERVFAGVCGYLPLSATTELAGRIAPVQAHPMSGECFSLLGLKPAVGRLLTVEDEQPGRDHVAVITWDAWTQEFGGRASVINERVNVDGASYLIVGVTERGFTGVTAGTPARLFIPFGNFDGGLQAYFPPPDLMVMNVIARRRIEEPVEAVRARLAAGWNAWLAETASLRLSASARQQYLARALVVEGARSGQVAGFTRQLRAPTLALLVIAAAILLMTCVNAANLLIARATVRKREAAVRLALGASRGGLLREAIAESVLVLLLALAGAATVSWFVVWQLINLFRSTSPDFGLDVGPDWRVYGFTAGIAIAAWAVFAWVPAWRASRADASLLASSSQRLSGDHGSLRQVAVSAQVALTVLLLSLGAWFVGELIRLRALPLGLDVEEVSVAQLSARPGGYDQGFASNQYYRQLLDRLEARPDLANASLVRTAPFADQSWKVPVAEAGGQDEVVLSQSFVSDRFFDTLGIPIVVGREFSRADAAGSRRVAILSRAAARALFNGEPAVGRYIRVGAAPANQRVEVLAVADDAVLGAPQQGATQMVYLNFWQFGPVIQTYPSLLVKAKAGSPFGREGLAAMLDEMGREYVSQWRALDERRDDALMRETLLAYVAGAFAVLGLTLATVGLYGLLTFLVAERTTEFGIRMALGATGWQVSVLVIRNAVALTLAGGAAGCLAAYGARQLMSAAVFGDPQTSIAPVGAAVLALTSVAIVAALLATQRAARVNPSQVLR